MKRAKSYQIRFQKLVWKAAKKQKLYHRRDRLLGLSLRKKGYNMRRRKRKGHRIGFRSKHIKGSGRFYEQQRRTSRWLKRKWKKARLKMLRRRGRNARPSKTPYKWFVKYYGVKEGARYYRAAKAKRHY